MIAGELFNWIPDVFTSTPLVMVGVAILLAPFVGLYQWVQHKRGKDTFFDRDF